jgi:hypothetical protein
VATGLGPCSSVGIASVCKVILFKVTYFGGTTLVQFMWWCTFGCVGKGRVIQLITQYYIHVFVV